MNFWLFMFRPDTYEKVKQHQTVGVREGTQKRFSRIQKGDRFVAYVSRAKILDGYGAVSSDPFEDVKMIFSNDRIYPHRCKVAFEKSGCGKPAGDALWSLAQFSGEMAPSFAAGAGRGRLSKFQPCLSDRLEALFLAEQLIDIEGACMAVKEFV